MSGLSNRSDRAAGGWTLFLDFDGVLNNDRFLRHQINHLAPADHRLFDRANVTELERLCDRLPVVAIVVTSSWRLDRTLEELRDLLAREGAAFAPLVTSSTPSFAGGPLSRAEEILAYLASHEVSHWLALDDFDLDAALGPRFFRTSPSRGLTTAFVDEILDALCGECRAFAGLNASRHPDVLVEECTDTQLTLWVGDCCRYCCDSWRVVFSGVSTVLGFDDDADMDEPVFRYATDEEMRAHSLVVPSKSRAYRIDTTHYGSGPPPPPIFVVAEAVAADSLPIVR